MDERASIVTDNALTYGDALPEGGALLGLDLGTKTIGVATCDAGWRFATAGKTISRSKFAKDCTVLRALVQERSIRGVVIGLPRNMDGTEGPRAQASRAYAKNLAKALELPVLLWDERWSTSSAEAAMIGQDMSRAKRARKIDSHAAAVILQGAIDALAGGGL
ncbi:Holliday junction resolvase RuvX [Erythrobacter sp.]|uniref:Holliday junction resolvase RuvX n=1 Tax=Erythrobacter sp. TaxID=1042 RepID=UPI001B0CBBDB|nr:Holliday junction resolvase RuvX [Erythrobacter sp.]MBO6527007.1 Holliday junction resolvase RuvX [Erythrobacter sp.]MBO6528888.1 Holliday junction resolvase RuvX [Erythrobacter sp.]